MKNMTYILHAHLHLPMQVLRFGPLHKFSYFPFKGHIKVCKSVSFGSRGLAEQIKMNLKIRQQLNFVLSYDIIKIKQAELRNVLSTLDNYKKKSLNNIFLQPIESILIVNLDILQKKLIQSLN